MRKTALSVLAVLLVCGCAWGDRIPSFSAFPTWGICTGDYVRMREEPSTKAKVLEPQRLNRDQRVIVLDETEKRGEIWYEIDHPTEEGSAWVSGKFIQAVMEEEYQEDPMRQLLVKLNLTFGSSPEKARALFGKPVKQKREVIGSDDDITRITMSWQGHEAEYLNGSLTGVTVTGGKTPFGRIRIGDKTDRLQKALGKPSDATDETWTYQPGEMDYVTFSLKDGKVSGMGYQFYYDIGESESPVEPEPKPEPEPKKPAKKRETPKPRKESEEEFLTESARREAAGDWKDTYPDTGICVGDSVRLRENPDTESEIVGRLNKGDWIITLEETSVDGQKWYAVDHPTQEGTAWVSARYIETYKGYEIGTPAYNMVIRIMMNFGLKPEKAHALLGDPDRELEDEGDKKILEYGDCRIVYVEGRLRSVEVFERGLTFGSLKVGDSESKLTNALGDPTEKARGDWCYEIDPNGRLTFTVDNGKIVHMLWEELMD